MTRTISALIIPSDADAYIDHITVETATYQDLVGGLIQPIYLMTDDALMFVNEDGKNLRLGANQVARALLDLTGSPLHPDDFVVGPAVLVGLEAIEAEDGCLEECEVDLPDWVPALLKKYFIRFEDRRTN